MHSILPKILLVSVQLLAIILLQLPAILPLLGKAFSFQPRGSVCYHDHRLCDCSPDRIANHTCCCARSAEQSLVPIERAQENNADSCCHHGQRSSTRHVLKIVPCGAASPLFMASVQEYLFVHNAGGMSSPVSLAISFFDYPGSLQMGYSNPPDPPPRYMFSV
jgi:hypothetical protein